ncbi:MAG: hypothetical protein WD359_01315 [Dehalococcoidia bacterium]
MIVDQLSSAIPNSGLIDEATSLLEGAGYEVDYVPGEQVTVDFYRHLPDGRYDVVLLRSHVARENVNGAWGAATLFTSEPVDASIKERGLPLDLLGIVTNTYEPGKRYVGVRPTFIEQALAGYLDDATIILMGCDGMLDDALALAFIARGAKEFISWDYPVTPEHNDVAASRLLRNLLLDRDPVKIAVADTMAEVGADPAFGARLRSYP